MNKHLLWILCLYALVIPASAHEVRPAYLEIHEVSPFTYDFLWKTPAQGNMRLNLNVSLPAECRLAGLMRTEKVRGAVLQYWQSYCDGGILGKTISIENLEASLTDAILQYLPLSGSEQTLHILGSDPDIQIPVRADLWSTANTYFGYGVTHILAGIDHLLFVFCLLLLIKNLQQLLGAITAFTIAHSITLISTTLGWSHLAVVPVEATIALSIAFLAAEIIQVHKGETGTIQRKPWLAAFAFGLLHGFGFATVLSEIGLNDESILMSLLWFNVGIEVGQLMFVFVVLTGWRIWEKYCANLLPIPMKQVAYSIGILSSYWFIERAADIF